MGKKRVLSVFLAACLVLTLVPTFSLAAENTFSDMPADYSTTALEAAAANGLLKGTDGKILPDESLTRAQMAAIIVRAFGAKGTADLSGFSDVSAQAWYYGELSSAVQMKALEGSGATMRPEAPITRQEVFAVVARALKLQDGSAADLMAFTDAGSVASWAVGTTAAMVKAGYVHGADGKLNPTANISRKDFAVIMNNVIKTYVNTASVVTSVEPGNVMVNVPGATLKDLTVSGNLIVGDGVGDGELTLDNVKVTGAMIVRGGGVNSIIIKGGSSVGRVVVSKVDGNVRIHVEGGAAVEAVYVDDGKNDVIVEGKVDKLEVAASDVPVVVKGAQIGEVVVTADKADVTIDKDSTVKTVTASGAEPTLTVAGKVETLTATENAAGATIAVASGGNVTTANVAAKGAAITGAGTVTTANVSGNDVNVDTKGTTIKAAEGTTGITAGGKEVAPGETGKTSGGSSSGGSSSHSYAYKVAIKPSAGGTVTADTMQTDTQGTQVTLTVTPAEGYKLDTLTVKLGGKDVAVDPEKKTFTMDEQGTYTVTATFIAPLNAMDVFVVKDADSYAKLNSYAAELFPEPAPENIGTDPWLAIGVTRDASLADDAHQIQLSNITIKHNGTVISTNGIKSQTFGHILTAYLGDAAVSENEDALNQDTLSGTYEVTITFEGVTYTKSVTYQNENETTHAVTFQGADGKTVVSYVGAENATVAIPDAPEVAGEKFVGWYNGETKLEGPTCTVGNADVTYSAKYVAVKAQPVSVRPAGPAGETENFDYAATYAAAGVTFNSATNTYTVDQKALIDWAAENANADAKTALTHESNLYLGLQFDKPADVAGITKVSVKIGNSDAQTYDLGLDGDSVYHSQYIEYFGIAGTDGSDFGDANNKSWNIELDWLGANDTLLAATKTTVTRNMTNVDNTAPAVTGVAVLGDNDSVIVKGSDTTLSSPQSSSIVKKIKVTMSEPVRILSGDTVQVGYGDTPAADYGKIAVDPTDPSILIITPDSNHQWAVDTAGTFTFTLKSDTEITDRAGNQLDPNASFTLIVPPSEEDIKKALTDALDYQYDDYTYHNKITVASDDCTITYSGVPADFTEGSPTNATQDLARYLGALYRINAEIVKITFNDVEYTWDENAAENDANVDEDSYKGSNWVDKDGKTLVSAIASSLTAETLQSGSATLSLSANDVEITLTITISKS